MNTLPVGLLGVFRMMALVLAPKAAASSSRSNDQSGFFWRRRLHTHEVWRSSGKNRIWPVVFVKRLEDHGFVAGIDDGHHGGHHGFGGAAADGDFAFGVVAHGLRACEFFHDGVAQWLGAPGDCVLIDVVGDGLASGFLDFLGCGEIRKTLGKIDGIVLHRQARHFADHRFGELFGFGGNHTAGNSRHFRFRSAHVAPARSIDRAPD